MNEKNLVVDTSVIALNELQILEALSFPFSIKTKGSVYVAANTALARLTGFASAEDLIGIQDKNLNCDAAELHELFVVQDSAAIDEGKQANLDVCNYIDGRLRVFLSTKTKLVDLKKNEYVISSMREIPLVSLSNIVNHLSSKKITKPEQLISSYSLGYPEINNKGLGPCKLTSRQSECLFHIMRGKTQKEVAVLLSISLRTVEEHIDKLKKVFDCTSRSRLIDKAYELGFAQIIPPTLFQVDK